MRLRSLQSARETTRAAARRVFDGETLAILLVGETLAGPPRTRLSAASAEVLLVVACPQAATPPDNKGRRPGALSKGRRRSRAGEGGRGNGITKGAPTRDKNALMGLASRSKA